MIKYIIPLFLILNFAFGFDSVEVLNKEIHIGQSGWFKSDKPLTPQMAYHTFKDNNFFHFSKEAKSFGFSTSEYWFAFDITLTKKDPHFLVNIKDPLAQYCVIYVFQNNQLIYSEKNGYMIPLENRKIDQFPIRFALTNDNINTTYLIKTVSQYPLYTAFTFGEQYELDNELSFNYIIFILSCGIFFAMFFYNIFLYFTIKDKAYIFYCIYVFGFFMITLLAQGYISLIAPSLIALTPLFVTLFLLIELIGLVFFTSYFLNLKKTFPTLAKTIYYLLYANIIASLTVPFASEIQILSMIFMNALYIVLIYSGFRSYFSGYKPALYYLIATGIALIAIFAYSFMNQGVFLSYNVWSFNLMTFGLVWDMLFLSFALAYRVKLLQKENSKNERLAFIKSKETAIGELSGNIAHQWRTPLAAIGTIQANMEAKLRFSDISKEELLEQIKLEKSILQHLSSTVDTFQSFFQNNPTSEIFSVNDEIKRCVEFIQQAMITNKIQLEFIENTEASLQGNKNEFSQIILNIILNAKDILIARDIKNKKIQISLNQHKDKYLIEIKDNAGGIKIQPIESIFESYVTDKETGSGIGLFIAKTIVDQKFSGKIFAHNDKDGAVFEISFSHFQKS